MKPDKDIEWQKIENEIYAAFKDVKLEDGIGYYEAGAIDDYLQPADPLYQAAKAKDNRNNWTELLTELRVADVDNTRHCFMDAKGLSFYIPFLMVRKDSSVNSILHSYISEFYKRQAYQKSNFTGTVELLTKAQKLCIYHFYEYLSKIKESDFYVEYLDSDFATGEIALKDFNFMEFLKKQFGK